MARNLLTSVQLAAQAVGAIFVGTFLAAYLLSLPSYNVLHGQPIYHLLLSVFGGLFLLLVLVCIVLAYVRKAS